MQFFLHSYLFSPNTPSFSSVMWGMKSLHKQAMWPARMGHCILEPEVVMTSGSS